MCRSGATGDEKTDVILGEMTGSEAAAAWSNLRRQCAAYCPAAFQINIGADAAVVELVIAIKFVHVKASGQCPATVKDGTRWKYEEKSAGVSCSLCL